MAGVLRIKRPGAQEVSRTVEAEFDHYFDRLMKMIPAEVVGLYLVGSGFIPQGQPVALISWSIVCVIGLIIIRAYATADLPNNKPPQPIPIMISAVAFVIWLYTIGGPFLVLGVTIPWLGSLLVLAWSFFVPLIYKGPLDT